MARDLIPATTCDWHTALPNTQGPTQGSQVRTLDNGKEVDLCQFCAWVFDFFYPRSQEVLALLQPAVLDAFYRSARDTGPTRKVPAQLSLAQTEQPKLESTGSTSGKSAGGKRTLAKFGAWKDDAVQIQCPLSHRPGSSPKYWVELRNRTGHARMHKKENGEPYHGPDIAFELQPGQQFTHFCTEHAVCAEHGGYGFLSETALTAHSNKSKDWPRATQEARDAAETRLQKQAA
ncbi:hypothetical protein [Streptomyces microflavus]|uniref:hypothetical protein n=1 Tax=Streptomyces microflavus TaxID=1919 RepID=UPI0033BBCE64